VGNQVLGDEGNLFHFGAARQCLAGGLTCDMRAGLGEVNALTQQVIELVKQRRYSEAVPLALRTMLAGE
jgi:hypothetical protein